MSGNVLKCKTAPQTKYIGDACRQGKFSSWVFLFFFLPLFPFEVIWGQNFTNNKTQITPCLETSVDVLDFISGLVTKVILLCKSAHRDAVGEGGRNKQDHLFRRKHEIQGAPSPAGGGETQARGGPIAGSCWQRGREIRRGCVAGSECAHRGQTRGFSCVTGSWVCPPPLSVVLGLLTSSCTSMLSA